MKKRVFSTLIAAALVLALLPAGAFAATVSTDEASQVLAALNIMVGDQNGNLNLSNNVTRAEFTKMAVMASPLGEGVGGSTNVSPYPDVPYTHWAAPYVEAAVTAGYVNGYTNGTFRPSNQITLAEGVTILLRLLGYEDSDFTGAFPAGQMSMYRSLGLNENVSASEASSVLNRQDSMYLFYNLLTAKTKAGQVYLVTLGHTLTATGEIDRVALINEAMEGPVVASANWQSNVGFNLNTAKVYRSGASAQLSDIQSTDVVYWSNSMRTIWAFTDQVTGTYQSASPNVSNPTSVVVAGNTYTIETASAAYDLSDLGPFQVGDTVTLLLGRSGGVAAVLSPENSSVSGSLYGVVTGLGTATYTDPSGNKYNTDTVTLMGTDGRTYSYPWSTSSFDEGDIVKVTTVGASVTLSGAGSGSLSGTVNGSGTAIGSQKIASNCRILETYGEANVRKAYASRLAGVQLKSGSVRFYATNAKGEITDLILNDVTGDGHTYGVLTSVKEQGYGMNLIGVYEYDVNGSKSTLQSSNRLFNVKTGPFGMVTSGTGVAATVDRMYNLTPVKFTSATTTSGIGGDGTVYRMADQVTVYEKKGSDYYATTLSRVAGKSLTGYYDKTEREGGRIRIIVAQ